ncbi:hypothetical protein Acsp01_47750 [Actinoplanes sp. NBRC 101535]|nr:hypothetical protein Acsp01_47750 [Actinoplanes sp. NBRC 101535]
MPAPRTFPVNMEGMSDLAAWERIRRYAVPASMIAACAEARERGDWRAACAAARYDIAFDALDDDLAGEAEKAAADLAPDLLRWHLPRILDGYHTLVRDRRYALIPDEPSGVFLTVRTARSRLGSQRLTLAASRSCDGCLPVPAHQWSATGDHLGVPGNDRLRVQDAPTLAAAFGEAGLVVTDDPEEHWPRYENGPVMSAVDPVRLARDVRWLSSRCDSTTWALWVDAWWFLRLDVTDARIGVSWQSCGLGRNPPERLLPRLEPDQFRYSLDHDLIARGLLTPDDLHPLARDIPSTSGPAVRVVEAAPADTVRVPCQEGDHEVGVRLGCLELCAHTPAEQQRERTLRALRGEVTGCFALDQAWSDGAHDLLPPELQRHRDDLWQRMIHGGTGVVLSLLDEGLDPQLKDPHGRTLLHWIVAFDPAMLLPRLIAAGLDVNARDRDGNTPLHYAVDNRGPAALLVALAEAGADPDAVNSEEMSPRDHLATLGDAELENSIDRF